MAKKQETKGRQEFRYINIPLDLYEELKAWAEADERSVPWAAKTAIRKFLDMQKSQKENRGH